MAQIAPSPEVQQAERLLQTADLLVYDDNTESVDPVLMAYEQALDAYDSLDRPDTSLSIYNALADLNYAMCRDPQAVSWAKQALQFIEQQPLAEGFDVSDHLNNYRDWSQKLGEFYRVNERSNEALEAYIAGLRYGADWPQSAIDAPEPHRKAALLRSQLSLIPPDSIAADETEQMLVDTWQLIGAIEEVDGLLRDVDHLADQGIAALELLVAQALETSRRHGYGAGELKALLLSGQIAMADNAYDRADDYAQQAMELAQQLRDGERFEYEALYLRAQAKQGNGDLQDAIEQYVALLEKINQPASNYGNVSEFAIVTNLVALYQQTGQSVQAQTLIGRYNSQSLIRGGLSSISDQKARFFIKAIKDT